MITDNILQKASKIKCLISDVDGVLTNGYLYLDNYGNELKAFHVQDGLGLKLLMQVGIHVGIITASVNEVITHRMQQLGIKHVYTGKINKSDALAHIKHELSLEDETIAYIGDDLPDLPLMKQVGLGIAPSNAVPLVKEIADWIIPIAGGEGAVRLLCDTILKAQGKDEEAIKRYLT
jgi:3-deoxy-D-manno-octulosonate 8-phosphate phosphatase (KDO 8-P phosphatase)